MSIVLQNGIKEKKKNYWFHERWTNKKVNNKTEIHVFTRITFLPLTVRRVELLIPAPNIFLPEHLYRPSSLLVRFRMWRDGSVTLPPWYLPLLSWDGIFITIGVVDPLSNVQETEVRTASGEVIIHSTIIKLFNSPVYSRRGIFEIGVFPVKIDVK